MMTTGYVPRAAPYIHLDELADLLNKAAGKNVWDARRVRRTLGPAGAMVRIGHRWVTTRQRLRDAFPDMWGEILLHLGDPE